MTMTQMTPTGENGKDIMTNTRAKQAMLWTLGVLAALIALSILCSAGTTKTLYSATVDITMPGITNQRFTRKVQVYESNVFDARRAAQRMVEYQISVEVRSLNKIEKP